MATLKLDLSNLSVITESGTAKFYVIDANNISLKYAGYKAEEVSDTKVTFADGSTLTIDTDNSNKLVFSAASGTGTFMMKLPALVGDSDIVALVGTADGIAKAAAAKADAGSKIADAKDALIEAAKKAGKNTLAYAVYTKLASADDNFKSDGSVETGNFDEFTDVFTTGTASRPDPATLDFSNAGAITYDGSANKIIEKLTGSAYADKLTIGAATVTAGVTVDAGEGNDVLNIAKVNDTTVTVAATLGDGDDVLNVYSAASVNATVSLGDGKDVVNIASDKASVTISDYNYADGDKINLTYANASTALDTVALSTVNGATDKATIKVGDVSTTVVASDYVAAANISGGDKTITFFTATDTGATQTKEVEINAKGISNETRINTEKSKLANITLGSGESKVTLADNGEADVINATGAGKVTVQNFKENKDTLILDGAKLTNIKLATVNTNDAELTYGKTAVDLVGLATITANQTIKLNDDTLAYDLKGNQTLKAGATMYYGNEAKNTVVETTDNVHLTEVNKYKNIYKVAVAGTGVEADKLDLSGFTTSGTDGISIDAGSSNVAVNVWAYNKNTKATDKVTLSAADTYQDTVSFVSDDGKVSVTGFDFGSGEKNDILYLRDTKDLQKLAVKSGEIKLGNSKATIGHTGATTDLMQVKLADGTTSLVAGNFSTVSDNVNSVNVDLTSTQAVDFYALTGTKNTLNVTKKGSLDDAVNFKYSNFDANHTTGTKVKDITVSGFANEDDEVTVGAVANVVATDVTSGKTHIWVCGAAESGTVNLTGNGSKDQIDFMSGTDKKVTVTGYEAADDTIYLRGAEDLKAVTAGYKFDYKNGGIQIVGADNAASKLVLDGAKGELSLKTLNGSSLKAIVSDAEATFSTDTQIYAGMKKIVADMSTEGDVAVRIGTKGEIGLDSSSTYYVDNKVTEFDGSNSNAIFHLAGSSTAATTLKGGNTENSFYGGGSFNDKMVGNSSAVDTFYFGKGEGKDTIEEADGKDTVCLLGDVSVADISIDTKKNVISIGASDTLTFGQGAEDALKAGELTFNIGGNNYVCKDGKFVAKEA